MEILIERKEGKEQNIVNMWVNIKVFLSLLNFFKSKLTKSKNNNNAFWVLNIQYKMYDNNSTSQSKGYK